MMPSGKPPWAKSWRPLTGSRGCGFDPHIFFRIFFPILF